MIGTPIGAGDYEFGEDYPFEDIFPDPSPFGGVKALFGPITQRYLCFGKGSSSGAAAMASKTPWAICIGAKDAWAPRDRQRVLNLVKLTTSQQTTSHLATTAEEKNKFGHWPEAVAVSDVFKFISPPHVMDDLGMQKHPLTQAHSRVSPLDTNKLSIVAALRGHQISLVDLPPLPPEITVGKLVSAAVSVEEGRAIVREVTQYERDAKMAKLVKILNSNANGGVCVCEGCGFRSENSGLFDAHHKSPLHFKVQTTTPALMAVLCPTCHRVVHRLAKKLYLPLPIPELRDWHARRAAALCVASKT